MTSVQKENCMKAILVIDMPKSCAECKLIHLQGIGESICNAVDWEERPSWCPLRPLPDRENPARLKDGTYFKAYDTGWNDCLAEITGEIE